MDKLKLKNILHEQFSPFDEAVQKKLEYLMSDDVFSLDNNPYANSFRSIQIDDEDDFAHAFSDDDDSSIDDAFDADESYDDENDVYEDEYDDSDDEEETETDSSPKSLAERIALLRGVSNLPGSYLHKKN